MAYEEKKGKPKSFKQLLGSEELKAFNAIAKKPFAEQAQEFLNAYWHEVKGQKDFIFNVSYQCFRDADMRFKSVEYVHLYKEGLNLDFDAGIYFFEQMCKHKDLATEAKRHKYPKEYWLEDQYSSSWPVMKTSIVRKKEFKKKVDVNFDNRISFLEFLLYQYEDLGCKPLDFCKRVLTFGTEPEEVTEARVALNKLLEVIAQYEAKKAKLEKIAKDPKEKNVKKLAAVNQLAQLGASPLGQQLQAQLITAQAKVRIVLRKYKISSSTLTPGGSKSVTSTNGSAFWLKSALKQASNKYKKKGR